MKKTNKQENQNKKLETKTEQPIKDYKKACDELFKLVNGLLPSLSEPARIGCVVILNRIMAETNIMKKSNPAQTPFTK